MGKEKAKPVPKKRGVGKPPKNDPNDIDAIQGKIDTYFDECAEAEKRPTYCGLALALDYSSRQALWQNAKAGNPISLPIKKAMLKIEDTYEQALAGNACTGAIFALKNRGWSDKNELELSGKDGQPAIEVKIVRGNK